MFASVRSVAVGVAIFGAAGMLAAPAAATPSQIKTSTAAGAGFSSLAGSVTPTTDVSTGTFQSGQMSIEVVLAPRNESQLSGLLTNLYDANNRLYHNWLAKGQFNALFAPSSAQRGAVAGYLQASGLVVGRSPSPFIVRASGSSRVVAAAFRTSLQTFRNPRGTTYFSNVSEAQLPATLAPAVLGVFGLSNTVRSHPGVKLPMTHTVKASPSCETPYVTRAQLYAAVNHGTPFPYGYGGGPGCNGLTPSQDNAIYGAPNVGARGKGLGVNLAVFELSAYRRSDITTWAHTFYGSTYSPRLVDLTVDGGPLSPICPPGDSCPPEFNGYSGDIEVAADIEMQLAVSPDASHILVYNAPDDFTGQTELDEYIQIASDDLADTISSSWGTCENDISASYARAENLIFEEMALQGQSLFGAAGDSGAFDCILTDGTTVVSVDDPSSQPWMTSVGGTSFESFNPGGNAHPAYPAGTENVWNVDGLCNLSANEGGHSGLFWCAETGAGGGGNSKFWGRPFYQYGPRITNPYTAYGNGRTNCSLAPVGTPCREAPDVSANADQYTPYAEFCTGNPNPPDYSTCGTFSGGQTPPGWFGIGGTSLSSPFWSAIIADRDSYHGSRSGAGGPLLYLLYNLDQSAYFHDITKTGTQTINNGLFPTTPQYDLATGIGTPKMKALITDSP